MLAGLALSASAGLSAFADCPGYTASNVVQGDFGLTADLTLAGTPCNAYGEDLTDLKLVVEYQTDKRLHVIIHDADEEVYQIQESLISRPPHSEASAEESDLEFSFTEEPFSFQVSRRDTGEVLFDTSAEDLIFESQYVRLTTKLPKDANLYGLGEHSDPFHLLVNDTTYHRTFWNSEKPFIPRRANLYGTHPLYHEHRVSGSHGVLLFNADGMDINFTTTADGDRKLDYNILGGVLDFYFFAGPEPGEVSKQYAQAFGLPIMMPYWSLGYQQAKYGYWDVNYLAEVVANYSTAGIPLEVIWADIDFMNLRKDFTNDPERFQTWKMREFIETIHNRGQRFVTILDSGVSVQPGYEPYARGLEANAFMLADDGSDFRGVQWAGEVAWPDYLLQGTQDWWADEIVRYFDPEEGIEVDGLWIDMNEYANFCRDTACDPRKHAADSNTPPPPKNAPRNNTGRPIPGFPASFQPDGVQPEVSAHSGERKKKRSPVTPNPPHDLRPRQEESKPGDKKGLPGRELFKPPYRIANVIGELSGSTVYSNVSNGDGTTQYDTHNLNGLAMSKATYKGLLQYKPGKRPFVLTRSTFLTNGLWAAHWFGDNYSAWDDYRISIQQMLGFTAVHNMPMVGTDVCGFNGKAQENMCARWATLASFMPFMRNHADTGAPVQEFYQWPSVILAAKKGIAARYRLLDYLYTALWRSHTTGSPSINPLFFLYPKDPNTFPIDMQFVVGESVLVCPVHDNDATSVTFYLPDDVFYDFWTGATVRGQGDNVTLSNVPWTDIPVYYRGGSVVPLRSSPANTTTVLRQKSFQLVVAPGLDGSAKGSLFLDDGESIDGSNSDVYFSFDGATLKAEGTFNYESGLVVESVLLLGQDASDEETGGVTIEGAWSLDGPFEVSLDAKQ